MRIAFLALTASLAVTITPAAGAQNDAPPLPAPGRLIDVGGWRLHLNCTGPIRRDQPTVILEAGVGAFSVEWSLVQPRIAEFARVCSYDRAGSGWSDWGPHPRTLRQVVYELHTLLSRAGERAPYVLVGASYGGWVVRVFQITHPDDVAGMVLVDAGASDPLRLTPDGREVRSSELVRDRTVPPVKTSGPLRLQEIPPGALAQIRSGLASASARANEPPRDRLPPDAQRMRTWGLGQVGHVLAAVNPFEAEELAAMRSARSEYAYELGDLPLVVLTRGRAEEDGPDAAAREQAHREEHARVAGMSMDSRQIIADQSGHHIQIEDPAQVVEAVREVLARHERRHAGPGNLPDTLLVRILAPAIFENLKYHIARAASAEPAAGTIVELPGGAAWEPVRRHIMTVMKGRDPLPTDSVEQRVWLKDLKFFRDTLWASIGTSGHRRCPGGGRVGSTAEDRVMTVRHGRAWEAVRVLYSTHGDALWCPK